MNFYQFILILQARKNIVLLTLLVTVSATVFISLMMPKTYLGSASVVVDFKGFDPITGIVLPSQPLPGYMAMQEEIFSSHNVAMKVVARLKLAERPDSIEKFNKSVNGKGNIQDWLADGLLEKLDAKSSRESGVINVGYSDKNPQLAAEIANAFVDAYIQTNLELKVEPARQRAAWFDEQIKGLRARVEELQKKLADYQQETGLITLDGRLDIETARLSELSTQLVEAQKQTYDSVTRKRQITGAQAKGKLGELPEILGNLLIQSLKADLAKAEGKLAEVSQRVDKNHPQYQSAQAEVQSLRQKIDAEIQAARGSIENSATLAKQREEEITKALADQKARVIALKERRDRIDLLSQELASARAALDSTSLRANQIRLESQRNLTDIMILNPALVPVEHAKPKLRLNVAASVFLGTLLGVGLSFMLEMFDRRIRSVEDVTEGLALPVLAVLSAPSIKKLPG
jgi:chain length determinant protein EpsF